jgi:hypothetical protein
MWLGLVGAMALPAMAIEEPAYKVVGKQGRIELREYSAYLVAETRVKAGFDQAGSLAFRPLFNFISGSNRQQERIDMTAPVRQSAASSTAEKIDMTAPVTQSPASGEPGSYLVGFVMPSRYKLETVPQPMDARVSIREIPARRVAVIAYSGTWSEERYRDHENALIEDLGKAGWRARGAIEFARYDPPFMPWFLRRNEIMVEVEPSRAPSY